MSMRPVSRSTIRASVSGRGTPTLPTLRAPPAKGLTVTTGVVSVMPKPSTMTAPVIRSNSWMTSTGSGALPEKAPLMQDMSVFLRSGWLSIPMYMVGTSAAKVGRNLRIASSSCGGWGRGISTSVQPMCTEMFMAPVMPKT